MEERKPFTTPEGRLPSTNSEVIDRRHPLQFRFDGRKYGGFTGDTIGSALYAAGQRVLSRSFKYHRKRGYFCGTGDCPSCLVQVGSEPNVRACQRPLEDGMEVHSQNRWPSLSFDVLNLADFLGRFLPPGFYYKAFLRPAFFWPFYQRILRSIAGLGSVNVTSKPELAAKEYLHPDVTVIGGGPAGLRASLSAVEAGATVLLIEQDPRLGGHALLGHPRVGSLASHEETVHLIESVRSDTKITVLTNTTLFGVYEQNWLAARANNRLFKVRTKSLILATGSREQPLVFENNDLPGIMLSSAAQRLLHLWAVRPGQRGLVVAPHRNGWQTALDLAEAGVEVQLVANPVGAIDSDLAAALTQAGVATKSDTTINRALGRGQLSAVELLDRKTGEFERIHCDLLIASSGFNPANELLLQAGGETHWDESRAEFLPASAPAGTFLAGGVNGCQTLSETLISGQAAGKQAAAYAFDADQLAHTRVEEPPQALAETRSMPTIAPNRAGKSFVCYCEDVTSKDIKVSIDEGYNSLELLKRYSTISMGPCQGKMCNLASIQLCARETGRSIPETGRTTARPPVQPVSLAAFAGIAMDPVKRTPLHDWHEAQSAEMMVAGAWLRPEHYGDPTEELTAVRQRVGLIDVSTLGKYHLHGPDGAALLEKIYTNQWRGLAIGRVRYGLMTNEEGIILDDGVTARLEENLYYVTTTSSGAASSFQWIQWWLQSGWNFNLHIEDATEQTAAMNLAGPAARKVLERVCRGVDLSPEAFPYMQARQAEVAGVPALLMRLGFTGELSFEIHTPSGYGLEVWRALMQAGQGYGIMPFGVEAQRVLRLEKGHVIVGQDTDSLTNPLEAGMGWAVKLEKDDFLGRAFLADAEKSEPIKQLSGFTVPEGIVPAEASQIVRLKENGDIEIIGRVTSARWSPTLEQVIGLAWLPAELNNPGQPFSIHTHRGILMAEVQSHPFYDPAGRRVRA